MSNTELFTYTDTKIFPRIKKNFIFLFVKIYN